MLCLEIHSDDLELSWQAVPQGWAAGKSIIRPFQHFALHAEMRCSPRRTAVVVRERDASVPLDGGFGGAPGEITRTTERGLDRWLGEAKEWQLDFVLLVIERGSSGNKVKFSAGGWGTAPVYLHTAPDVLRGSWDVADLYPHLRSIDLEPHFASQFLLYLAHPYSRRTIFPEIKRLTERSKAYWRAPFDQVQIVYPPQIDFSSAHRLRPGADVVGAFRDILQSSMRRWRSDQQQPIAIEISGGLDSTLVAATAARLPAPAHFSYGMVMAGSAGEHQRMRRKEVVEREGLSDRAFLCRDYPPYHPQSHRVLGERTILWSEYYEEAVVHLLELVKADGPGMILTGLGGDELCSYHQGEITEYDCALVSPYLNGYPAFVNDWVVEAYQQRHLIDDAPQAMICTSVIEAAAAVAPVYLRHGIWPVSPLTTPELVEFCRKLPRSWRHHRRIHRQVLTSFGYSEQVAFPKPEHLESFHGVMSYALKTAAASVIEDVFSNSLLEKQGFIDGRALIREYREHRARLGKPIYNVILGALVLELTLRSVERSRVPKGLTAN